MKRKKSTKAEEILTPFIKGDIRDYDKKDREHFAISLATAIKVIQKTLRIARPKKLYLLKADLDGTTRSMNQPIGVATASEEEAKRFVSESDMGYHRSYEEITLVNKVPRSILTTK